MRTQPRTTPIGPKTTAALSILKWIPRATRRFVEPRHLLPLADALERIRAGKQVEIGCDVPPRHGKTELLKHFVALLLLERPWLRIAWVTYGQTPSDKRSRETQEIYVRNGGRLDPDASARRDWRTGSAQGGLWATSPGGPITGEGFDIAILDDVTKDRATAESAIERDKVWSWWTDTMSTRREPGCSTIVCGTRWHVDDLGGRLQKQGMRWISLPAIDDEGGALCPERYDLTALAKIRETLGLYGWSSLYMGQPFARGGSVFNGTHFHSSPWGTPPDAAMRIKVGLDLAFTAKSRADYSVAVVLGTMGDGFYFVLDVAREQTTVDAFLGKTLQQLQWKWGNPRAFTYTGGQERALIDTLRKTSAWAVNIETRPAVVDKFQRAQPASAAWNAGRILLPRDAPWLDAFASEIVGFTGQGDRNDDQVDALAAAFDCVARKRQREQASAQRATAGMVVRTPGDFERNYGVASARYIENLSIDGEVNEVNTLGPGHMNFARSHTGQRH